MCIDSTTIKDPQIAGLSYKIAVVPDLDSSPDDADCYTATQKAAWARDEWSYVGVIVTPVVNGTELLDFDDSLWGLEYGDFTMTDEDDNVTGRTWLTLDAFTTETVHEMADGTEKRFPAYPVPDMISEVQHKLRDGLGGVIDALRKVEKEVTT